MTRKTGILFCVICIELSNVILTSLAIFILKGIFLTCQVEFYKCHANP